MLKVYCYAKNNFFIPILEIYSFVKRNISITTLGI